MIADPTAAEHPFFQLAPSWALIPLVVLTTLATVIASQAVISGAFSLTRQAVQLGYLPRVDIEHTSSTQIGQIYIPGLNWLLAIACIGARGRLPLVEQPRGRVRRRGDDGHGVHDDPVRRRRAHAVEVERRRRPLRLAAALPRGRPRVLDGGPDEDSERRLVPARDRGGRCSRS